MGTSTISAHWTGELLNFVGKNHRDREVLMGKGGFSPTQMMLIGLAGCMGMDVLSILQKKRQNVTEVLVDVTGHNADDYPKPYHTAEINFVIKGDKVDAKAVDRAIELSLEKYCIVGQTLQNEVELKTSFTIET